MSGPQTRITQIVIKEIGKRLSKLAARKAGSRLIGHLSRDSKVWKQAFAHIKDHFRTLPGKAKHAVFANRYRSEEAIKELVKQAAANPSQAPKLTKLTIGGDSIGRPAVIIERQFKQVVGHIGEEECKILRLIVDYTGRPITAYPVKQFIGVAGIAATVGTASTATADTEGPIDIVMEIYANERAEEERRMGRACDPEGVVGWVIDFLIAPSCIAPDPQELISRKELETRIKSAISELTRRTGTTLDSETQANIRRDIAAIWGLGYQLD